MVYMAYSFKSEIFFAALTKRSWCYVLCTSDWFKMTSIRLRFKMVQVSTNYLGFVHVFFFLTCVFSKPIWTRLPWFSNKHHRESKFVTIYFPWFTIKWFIIPLCLHLIIYIALAFTIYHGLTLEPLVVAEIGMPQAPVSTCSTRFAWLVRIRMCSTKVDPLELSCSTSCCL